MQCSAHTQVHLVTERYHTEVFVIDTFLYPTKELALLVRNDVGDPQSLGIVAATRGYTDLARWPTIVDEPSKPVVARHLLAGAYDAGLTHLHYAREHTDALRVQEVYGAVDTTWVVYGPRKRFRGEVIGSAQPVVVQRRAALHGRVAAPERAAAGPRVRREVTAIRLVFSPPLGRGARSADVLDRGFGTEAEPSSSFHGARRHSRPSSLRVPWARCHFRL